MKLLRRRERACLPKSRRNGEQGFTLIELLIVVAILGVLAAVVIPNVGRFIGRGETEAKKTELAAIQSATISMMTDRSLSDLDVNDDGLAEWIVTGNQTNNMSVFPVSNYPLYGANITGVATLVNYVVAQNTTYKYYVDSQGTVTQGIKAP